MPPLVASCAFSLLAPARARGLHPSSAAHCDTHIPSDSLHQASYAIPSHTRCACVHRPHAPNVDRQDTPSDTKGILSNANVILDERLDLLEFLEDVDGVACGMDGASSAASDTPTIVAASVLPSSAAVSWSVGPSVAADAGSSRRPVYTSALEVAIDAERRGALASLEDEIPPLAPWWLQATFCLCAHGPHHPDRARHPHPLHAISPTRLLVCSQSFGASESSRPCAALALCCHRRHVSRRSGCWRCWKGMRSRRRVASRRSVIAAAGGETDASMLDGWPKFRCRRLRRAGGDCAVM